VTVVATICADQTSLSLGLIYEGQPNTIQDAWLEGIDEEDDLAFLKSSGNGWTNGELGFGWLVNLLDRETWDKAKKDWRLLFLDGHGSHLTIQFFDWIFRKSVLARSRPTMPLGAAACARHSKQQQTPYKDLSNRSLYSLLEIYVAVRLHKLQYLTTALLFL
jgi:hypothetical protein